MVETCGVKIDRLDLELSSESLIIEPEEYLHDMTEVSLSLYTSGSWRMMGKQYYKVMQAIFLIDLLKE